ncbi:hypothetical protein M407DRAFT_25014 [Tulasnella calospora MUT 4182]|uniref:Uncharacterized protein n=1 Tax=Tulasnella calospora MUT 4182 TaxID=1051891 RepID=A0A0C3LW65_9AGAM|nr:hypothetical protein M407DRAFT_25014 [Tulasnella calospora MUT 4182]
MEQDNITQFLRKEILVDLNSLLHIPASAAESVRFMHTSIRDLLVSKQRCQDKAYHIDTIQYHQQLANLSLGFMLRFLKENICNLSDLSHGSSEIQDITEREVPKALRYCCRAWSIHLAEGLRWSESDERVIKGQIANFSFFSKERILAWIEVMSVIGATSEAIMTAKRVHHWLLGSPSKIVGLHSLTSLWNDVHRFIAPFLEPISFGPLHIYASALPHCPLETDLWRLYGSKAKIQVLRGLQTSTWPSNLWTRSANESLHAVAFSMDGSLVISATRYGEVQFWDFETGRQVGETLRGCSGLTGAICVSPDRRALAVGSPDGTIALWSLHTGGLLGKMLTSSSSWVRSVCFTLDDRVLASGSDDGVIRLWDLQTRRQLGKPLIGNSGSVLSVCFRRTAESWRLDLRTRPFDCGTFIPGDGWANR